MGIKRSWCWRTARQRWWCVALAGFLLATLGVRLPVAYEAHVHFPQAQPHKLAHLLADFSLQPNIGSWAVTEDHSNYTTWNYAVIFDCGTRCSGHGVIKAHDERSSHLSHGVKAQAHHVSVTLSTCSRLPFLPWPWFCDEMETVSSVSNGDGGGAALVGRWFSRCSAMSTLTGSCTGRLRTHHDTLLMRVRASLDEPLQRSV